MESKHPNVFICKNTKDFRINQNFTKEKYVDMVADLSKNVNILMDKKSEIEKRRKANAEKRKKRWKTKRSRSRRRSRGRCGRKKKKKCRRRKKKNKKRQNKKNKNKIFRSHQINPENSAVNAEVKTEQ